MGIVPLLETTCAAVYGRLTREKRESCQTYDEHEATRVDVTREPNTYRPPLLNLGNFRPESCLFVVRHDEL